MTARFSGKVIPAVRVTRFSSLEAMEQQAAGVEDGLRAAMPQLDLALAARRSAATDAPGADAPVSVRAGSAITGWQRHFRQLRCRA